MMIYIVLWVSCGILGYYVWWCSEFGGMDRGNIPNMLLAGSILGPLSWLIGWVIHGRFWKNKL